MLMIAQAAPVALRCSAMNPADEGTTKATMPNTWIQNVFDFKIFLSMITLPGFVYKNRPTRALTVHVSLAPIPAVVRDKNVLSNDE